MTTATSEKSAKDLVVIVGAGPAGSLLAVNLARMGYHVRVLERRSDPRVGAASAGRSINLALSTRGITALKAAGLDKAVLEQAIPMRGRMIHPRNPRQGPTAFQPYSSNKDDAIYSISRSRLNRVLVEAAGKEKNVELAFDLRCLGVNPEEPSALFEREGSHERVTVHARTFFGCDGAYSAVRASLQKHEGFNYAQDYLESGYKELHIPPRADGGFALEENALHIWPRGGSMMIALPNPDHSFTCTLFWPLESLAALRTEGEILAFFKTHYADAVPLMPTLTEDYLRNPVSTLVTVRCSPWNRGDRVLLLGDAAHAIVPFFGQGMNCALEDVRLLSERLAQGGDWKTIFDDFSRTRKPDTDAIADMALENFEEMRSKVASRAFVVLKKAQQLAHAWAPNLYLPLYNMVSFSNIPYARARARAEKQQRLLLKALIAATVLLLSITVLLGILLF